MSRSKLEALDEAPRQVRINVADLGYAEPGYAPSRWQESAPFDAYGGHKPPVGGSPDLARIVDVPRRPVPDARKLDAMLALMMRRHGRGERVCQCAEIFAELGKPRGPCRKTLKHVQAWALYEMGLARGLLGPIGVGHGKTIIGLLAAMAVPDTKVAALLVPSNLISQLIGDYRLAAEHFKLPQIMVHHGKGWNDLTNAGTPALHVMPYSRLSRPGSTVWFDTIEPDLIIADEAHKLRHVDGAGASRVMRHAAKHPGTRFLFWSGSMSDASIKDYAHLSTLALRENSPLPSEPEVVEDWARALDPAEYQAPPGRLLDLCDEGEHVYEGFKRRLHETCGVVHTVTSAVDCGLVVREREVGPLPEIIEKALEHASNGVRPDWLAPDADPELGEVGETLVDELAIARCLRELACGFFYRWRFPLVNGEPQSKAVIKEWFEKRKAWNQELRDFLKPRREHLDSPKLCRLAAMRAYDGEPDRDAHGRPLPVWHATAWQDWRDIRTRVVYETESIRLHDFLVQDAAAWCREHTGIVWYDKREFGVWLAEITGLPLHCGGPDAGPRILAERGDRTIIASIQSHGTGRDGLQDVFSKQLVANPPASPSAWEQMLGRLHRIGQKADVVESWFYRHTPELMHLVDGAIRKASYVSGTGIGGEQKLQIGWLEG